MVDYRIENIIQRDVEMEPDEVSINVSVLKTLQITANIQRKPGIYFTEPNTIEELVSEYTTDPANCPLMCACKGNKPEIAQYWKNPDTLNDRGIEMYIPFPRRRAHRGCQSNSISNWHN